MDCPGIHFDQTQAAYVIANMIEAYLDADHTFITGGNDDFEDRGATPAEAGLHLPSSIDDGTGQASPGEHPAAICPVRSGNRSGLAH